MVERLGPVGGLNGRRSATLGERASGAVLKLPRESPHAARERRGPKQPRLLPGPRASGALLPPLIQQRLKSIYILL